MLFLFALFNILTLICCKKDVFLYEECDNEICNWFKNSRFVGCIDKHVLRFSYFDTTSSIDLTCASVRQIFIQSEFDCKDVPSIIENAKNVPIVFVGDDETQCIISPSSHVLTKETVPDQTMGHIKSSPDHAMGHVTSNPGQTMGYVTSGPDQAMGHVMSSPAQTMGHVTSSPDHAMGYIASSSGDGMVHMSSQHSGEVSTDHETSTTGSTQSSSHDDGNSVPMLTILIIITTVLAAALILALIIIISWCKKKRRSNALYPKYYEQFELQSRDI